MEFLQPGETLVHRIDRIGGLPVYEQTRSGEKTGAVHTFRQNPSTGESIIWNPYDVSSAHKNIRITSPLFGPYVIAMVNFDLHMTNDGQRDKLAPTTGEIKDITLRFEGGTTESGDIGSAMMRLSKKLPQGLSSKSNLLIG